MSKNITIRRNDVYPESVSAPVFGMNLRLYKTKPVLGDYMFINHFIEEISTLKEYEGRELYELLQNAEDAGAHSVYITLDDKQLVISNDGDKPFTTKGYASILRPNQSSKRTEAESMIGNKGLGFRSVLNWSDSLSICSRLYPGSLTGIECVFSREIADKVFENLRKEWGELEESVEKEISLIAKKEGLKYPIALLSVPEVNEWTPQEEITTRITLNLKENVIERVKKDLQALSETQFLLFLKNIEEITIEINGEKTVIKCQRDTDKGEIHLRIDSATTGERVQKWLVENYSEDNISVGAARRVDEDAVSINQHDYLLHSYFPMKVKPGLGCVLHATMALDKSRNHALKTDREIFSHLEEVVVKLAERIKNYYLKEPGWDAYDVLLHRETGMGNIDLLGDFLHNIEELRDSKKICPTVNNSYIAFKLSQRITEDFSIFTHEPDVRNEVFDNVLLPGFTKMGIDENTDLSAHKEILQEFSQRSIPEEIRIRFIIVLSNINWDSLISDEDKLYLYIDENGGLIKERAYILTGRDTNIKLPSILPVKTIKPSFVDSLKENLKERLKALKEKEQEEERAESNDDRRLQKLLSDFSWISYTDFNRIKNDLFASSEKVEFAWQVKEILLYLYQQYQSYVDRGREDKFVLPVDKVLYCLDRNGKPRQICNLLYGETSGFWAPDQEQFNLDSALIPAEKLESFLIYKLHIGRKVPMLFEDWTKNTSYLQKLGIHPWQANNDYVKKHYQNKEGLFTYVIDPRFLEVTAPEVLILDIMEDWNAYRSIVSNTPGKYVLNYVPNRSKVEQLEVTYSPAGFSALSVLGQFKNYIIDGDRWIGDKLIDLENMTNDKFRIFKDLAVSLGAKSDESEMTMEEVYEIIRQMPFENHKAKYQRCKDLIKKSLDKDVPFRIPEDLTLWATMEGKPLQEKIKAGDCYYADNNPPSAVFNHFPIFDIGKREGVDLVAKIFGVNPVSSLKFNIIEDEKSYIPGLTARIKECLNLRKLYILAARGENFREDANGELLKRQMVNDLNNLEIRVFEKLEYTVELPDKSQSEVYELEEGQYIYDGKTYNVVLPDCNFNEKPSAVDAVAAVMCNHFKLAEKVWKERFYDIIRLREEDLSYRLETKYSEEYIEEIKNLLAGKKEVFTHVEILTFDSLHDLVSNIRRYYFYRFYLDYLEGSHKENQETFMTDFKNFFNRKEEEMKNIFYSSKRGTSKEEIRSGILEKLDIKECDLDGVAEVSVLPEYEEWLTKNIGFSTFHRMDYPEIFSLTFFPGNKEKIIQLYQEAERKEETDIADIIYENEEEGDDILEMMEAEDFEVVRPEEVTGERTRVSSGKDKIIREEVQKEKHGLSAEKRVVRYLKSKGFEVSGKSSNLDISGDDGDHYDIIFTDENGINHFVEVKSTTDGVFRFSEHTLAFAKEKSKNGERYDIYVVHEGKIYPIENAYRDMKEKSVGEQFRLKIKIK